MRAPTTSATAYHFRIRRAAFAVAASATVVASLAVPLAAGADLSGPTQLLSVPEGIAAPIDPKPDAAPAPRQALPKQTTPNSKNRMITVDLSDQKAYFYQDGVVVYTALVSTGLSGTPTNIGTHRIWRRVANETMSGPGYSLDRVYNTQYFDSEGEALHYAWWHKNFGRPMSHGCVNMNLADSKFAWDFGFIGMVVKVVP